jgi:acyl carrier protein
VDEVRLREAAPPAGGEEERLRANVRLIVLELAPNQDRSLGDDARLLEDLGYHSVGLMELAFTLEDEYDLMPIDEATGRSIRTIRDVQDHVAAEVMARSEAAAEG